MSKTTYTAKSTLGTVTRKSIHNDYKYAGVYAYLKLNGETKVDACFSRTEAGARKLAEDRVKHRTEAQVEVVKVATFNPAIKRGAIAIATPKNNKENEDMKKNEKPTVDELVDFEVGKATPVEVVKIRKSGAATTESKGLGVNATWVSLFLQNEAAWNAGVEDEDIEILTDPEITKAMQAAFPERDSKVFNDVSMVRGRYNRGLLTQGVAPDQCSYQYKLIEGEFYQQPGRGKSELA